MNLPPTVYITEVGPRDGLQMERRVLPTKEKLDLIAGLAQAGLRAIQVAALVHPDKVPSMADAEAVIAALPLTEGMAYSALTLNLKGVERACRTPIPWIEISLSAHDGHSRRNTGLSTRQALAQSGPMMAMAISAGRKIRGSIQCVFGYEKPDDVRIDDVVRIASCLINQGADLLVLADTTGLAAPPGVRRTLAALIPIAGSVPIGLHLHDTRGLGLVNVMSALEMGISHFDTSLGGLGGCPFIEGAAGNIATEDALNLFNRLNIATGIDMGRVASWSRRLSDVFGHALPGKLYGLASSCLDAGPDRRS